MFVYHSYRACVIGQILTYNQYNEEFQLSESLPDSSLDVLDVQHKMITELELAIEFSEGESKKLIWSFIRFLQSGETDQLYEYRKQFSQTTSEDIIIFLGFISDYQGPYNPTMGKPTNKNYLKEYMAFGGAILVVDMLAESRMKVIQNLWDKLSIDNKIIVDKVTDDFNYRPYELICATGKYGPEFDPPNIHYPKSNHYVFYNAPYNITNLAAINSQEFARKLINSSSYPIDVKLFENGYISYSQIVQLTNSVTKINSINLRSGTYKIRLQSILFSIWCIGQSEFLTNNLIAADFDKDLVYSTFLMELMDLIFYTEYLGSRFGYPHIGDVIATFLIEEKCIKIGESITHYYLKLVDSEKMTESVNKLMELASDSLGHNSVEWLDALIKSSESIFTDDIVNYMEVYQEEYSTNNYVFILPEPKLIRNKMGGITDVEMIHTLDFEGQMRKFEEMRHGQ